MTVLSVVLGIVVLTVLWERHTASRTVEADRTHEREQWAQERRSLLDRVQHPEIMQALPPESYEVPETPEDAQEFAKIGTIILGDPE